MALSQKPTRLPHEGIDGNIFTILVMFIFQTGQTGQPPSSGHTAMHHECTPHVGY